MGAQSTIDLGEARQNGLEFPLSLADKYEPRVRDFIGLNDPKQTMMGLLKRPKPVSILAIGPPGCGKTVMGMSFCRQLPGSLIHIQAQKCDVDRLESLHYQTLTYPPVGSWWFVLVDEADGMTEKAQLLLLSRMDGTASLKPVWGGGFVKGEAPPIIYYFTSNGRRVNGELKPPAELLPRFISRCVPLLFDLAPVRKLVPYLKRLWHAEKGTRGLPDQYFEYLCEGSVGVRDILMRLDKELIISPTKTQVKKMLAEREAKRLAGQNAEANKWIEATEIQPTKDISNMTEEQVTRHLSALKAHATRRAQVGEVA